MAPITDILTSRWWDGAPCLGHAPITSRLPAWLLCSPGSVVDFPVLGPLQVTVGGQPLAVGGARTRTVLALLLANANRVLSADVLADQLWPDLAGDRAAANLQVRLSELRRALRSAGEDGRLETRPPGLHPARGTRRA
jgi:Transcriptional regulatory protein, C terminal